MSTVNQQPLLDPLALSDMILCWSSANSDTRRSSLTALLALIQANLTFPVTPVAPGALIFMPFVGGTGAILVSPAAGVVLPAAPTFGQTIEFIASGTNVGAVTLQIGGTYPQAIQNVRYKNAPLTGGEIVTGGSVVMIYDGVNYQLISSAVVTSVPPQQLDYLCQGRLTGSSGVPVTIADVAAATTVYFTPYKGAFIDLYNSGTAAWVRFTLPEVTMDVPDVTQMNDVFIYSNAGVLTADVVAWASDTIRTVPLATQNGVLVKSGTPDRRYVGSFYSTAGGGGTTTDSAAKRYIWNYYNRVFRTMVGAVETADSWNYTTATYRQANGNAANQLSYCQGVSEDAVAALVNHHAASSTSSTIGNAGIGVDSSTVNSAQTFTTVNQPTTGLKVSLAATYCGYPGIGRHDIRWLETANAVGTCTWYGDNGGGNPSIQSGIQGGVWS